MNKEMHHFILHLLDIYLRYNHMKGWQIEKFQADLDRHIHDYYRCKKVMLFLAVVVGFQSLVIWWMSR